MSNIYIQEPPTNGKILLVTSVGEIDIELWSKEAPKACRNFVQLCMEGYYDGTIFHRVMRDFIVQGGDPTGTGHGGLSIYEQPFKDEIHSRLRFVRRGLVAMANAGPNDNGSQFFFTMGLTPELQSKHTIFGKVSGNTVYNMLKLQECEVGINDRPVFAHKIIKTQILSNPYDDIIPRVMKKAKTEMEGDRKSRSKSRATKNFKLLSFGEEAEEDEEATTKASKPMKGKSKSSHDLTNDPKLSAVPALEADEPSPKSEKRKNTDHANSPEDDRDLEQKREVVKKKLKKEPEDKPKIKPEIPEVKPPTRSEELKQEAKQLKKEIRESKRRAEQELKPKVPEEDKEEEPQSNDPLLDFKKERQKYKSLRKQQGKKGGDRESITLGILDKFKTKLQSARTLAGEYSDEEEARGEEDEEEEDPSDLSWMHHKLHFDQHIGRKVLDPYLHDVDRYEIHDPRNPITQRRREASKQAMKGK